MSKKQYLENLSIEAKRLKPLKKTNLSLIGDAESVVDKLVNDMGDADDVIKELNNLISDLEDAMREYNNVYNSADSLITSMTKNNSVAEDKILELEEAADNLGLNLSDVPVYKELTSEFLENQMKVDDVNGLLDKLAQIKFN